MCALFTGPRNLCFVCNRDRPVSVSPVHLCTSVLFAPVGSSVGVAVTRQNSVACGLFSLCISECLWPVRVYLSLCAIGVCCGYQAKECSLRAHLRSCMANCLRYTSSA